MPRTIDPGRSGRPYGWLAKIGLIVPPTNTVNEAEWAIACPRGVTVHAARMPLHLRPGTEGERQGFERDLRRFARDLAAAEVDAIAYDCTAGSLVHPLDSIPRVVAEETGIPAVATAPAIVAALGHIGARRIAIATPYADELNGHERRFFEACGFEVVSIGGMGFGSGGPQEFIHIARVPGAEVLAFALACDHPAADALVLSCTDLATLPIHTALESQAGKAVISSNQATLWAAMWAAGVPAVLDWGALFKG